MIPIPPSVLDDLSCLVADVRGKDSIVSTTRILDALDTGNYPCILFWLASFEKQKTPLSNALLQTRVVKPYSRYRSGAIRSWQVIS